MDIMPPARPSGHSQPAKSKPNPQPMRLAIGAGGIAALSALATAIVLPPRPATPVDAAQQDPPTSSQTDPTQADPASVPSAPIQYVLLSPGQSPPPGALVIQATASTADALGGSVTAPDKQPAPVGQQPAPVGPKPVPVGPAPAPIQTQQAAVATKPPPPPAPKATPVKTKQSAKPTP